MQAGVIAAGKERGGSNKERMRRNQPINRIHLKRRITASGRAA
jgi:hypothetical protein